jgi:hypothetical protein
MAKQVYILSERKKDSGESYLIAGVFSTNRKLNDYMTDLQGFNDGSLEFTIDLFTVDPTLAHLRGSK